MPRFTEQKLVPYRDEQLFDLVADVGRYPEFLPWCAGAKLRSATETELVADLTIGFGPFRESFTSRVALQRPGLIRVRYENGPFRYLTNQWRFIPDRARLPGGFLRRFRVPQPHSAGRDRGGVQRGGATHGQCIYQTCPRGLWPADGDDRGECAAPGRRKDAERVMVHAPPRPAADAPPVRVNLYSDTQTRPTAAMKQAMMEAEVGDEQAGLDPTVDALCARMAALLGTEAAMFLPSGTMCNRVALLTHCRPGDGVLAHETAHILSAEGGGAAALGGVQIVPLAGARGQFDLATLAAALLPRWRYAVPQTLVAVEQTSNLGGGSVWAPSALRAVADWAHAHSMATHMDGARLLNAVVAAGVPAKDMAAGYDSVWLDFTKGLGAPLGAVLCGSAEFIDRAWVWKQRLGGAMRQAGLCAAACLYALDHHVDRLAEDHANAAALARALAQIEGITVEAPDTNLVFFEARGTGLPAAELAARLRARGVAVSAMGTWRLRACTHLDVDRTQIELAAAAVREALAGLR